MFLTSHLSHVFFERPNIFLISLFSDVLIYVTPSRRPGFTLIQKKRENKLSYIVVMKELQ